MLIFPVGLEERESNREKVIAFRGQSEQRHRICDDLGGWDVGGVGGRSKRDGIYVHI